MKKTLFFFLVFVFSATFLYAETMKNATVEAIGKETALELKKTLMSKMQESIKKDGVVKTIDFCAKNALVLTEEVGSQKKGVKIKRVSQKQRNDFNAPDKIDEVAFEYFKQLKEHDGEYPSSFMTRLRHKKNKDINIYRYYEPMIIQEPCLACHGSDIKPEVKKAINSFYPNDKAVDYKLGDLRGLISVEITPDIFEVKQ
ncbi:MAG: hypothetical protein QG567_2255 [Campylobacterota bacterium]|nr:hypothetical protein [Campylobacterota bacterium]